MYISYWLFRETTCRKSRLCHKFEKHLFVQWWDQLSVRYSKRVRQSKNSSVQNCRQYMSRDGSGCISKFRWMISLLKSLSFFFWTVISRYSSSCGPVVISCVFHLPLFHPLWRQTHHFFCEGSTKFLSEGGRAAYPWGLQVISAEV